MSHFVRKHRRKIIAGHGVIVFALLATGVLTFNSGDATLFFMPHDGEKIRVGETAEVDVNITSEVAVNALGATIKFPPDLLEVVSIDKETTFFDLWTEDTAIREDIGEVHFSGGTFRPGGFSGTGTMVTLRFKALKEGTADVFFKEAEVYAHDGTGLVQDRDVKNMNIEIDPAVSIAAGSSGSTSVPSTETAAPKYSPSPDLNNDGDIDLVDVSILTFHFFTLYDPRYDLDVNGRIGLSDLSILFSKF